MMQESNKYTINFIIPYFGTFPNYFQLFLDSCSTNEDIDWTIITDNTDEYDYPDNVHIIRDAFDNVKQQIQKKFDFKISLDSAHKLCEYKPAYGYIFEECIKGYDFWGYCDIDVIYGRLRFFLKDEILDRYSKLFVLGHMSIIRNNDKCNKMFMGSLNGKLLYKEAFSSPENYNFDEEFLDKRNINDLFALNNFEVYRSNKDIADIYTKSSDFRLTWCDKKSITVEDKKKAVFVHEGGSLVRYEMQNGKLNKREYMYIHLQKRKMKIPAKFDSQKDFVIIPNRFENIFFPITEQNFKDIKIKRFNLQYFKIRRSNLIKKIIKCFNLQ